MFSNDYEPRPLIPETPRRILSVVAWVLFTLGMLEWFILGANRPLDPVVSPAVILGLPLLVRHLAR